MRLVRLGEVVAASAKQAVDNFFHEPPPRTSAVDNFFNEPRERIAGHVSDVEEQEQKLSLYGMKR